MGEHSGPPVTVAIPTYRCGAFVRRAVESVLAQSHRNLTVVVVSDGDPEPPWPALNHIRDPRLVRFALPENRGPYFAIDAVLRATTAPYLLVQDADDWSEPERLARLLAALQAANAVAASSAHRSHEPDGERIDRAGNDLAEGVVDSTLGWPFYHQALYRCDTLRALGGYYGGFHISYDRIIACLMRLVGSVAFVDEPLYNRLYRADSLSHARPGEGELARRKAHDKAQRAIYAEAREHYSRYRAGAISRAAMLSEIRRLTARHVAPDAAVTLAQTTALLHELLGEAPAERRARAGGARLPDPAPERLPLVSCTMPTHDRRRFVPGAIACFQAQHYPARELIILDDGDEPIADLVPDDARIRYLRLDHRLTLGAKRNRCAELARGEFLVHWDDDDWQAPWRVSYQVALLQRQRAQLCGARRILHYEPDRNQAWLFGVPVLTPHVFAGCCMAYRRSLWERFPFEHVTGDEDQRFALAARREPVALALNPSFMVAMIHGANVSHKSRRGPYWQPRPAQLVRDLLGPHLCYYAPAASTTR